MFTIQVSLASGPPSSYDLEGGMANLNMSKEGAPPTSAGGDVNPAQAGGLPTVPVTMPTEQKSSHPDLNQTAPPALSGPG